MRPGYIHKTGMLFMHLLISTSNMARHHTRCHERKSWGFRCDLCAHAESRLDMGLFRKHLQCCHRITMTNNDIENTYIFHVDDGYVSLLVCHMPECYYKCMLPKDMEGHFHISHFPESSPSVVTKSNIKPVQTIPLIKSETASSVTAVTGNMDTLSLAVSMACIPRYYTSEEKRTACVASTAEASATEASVPADVASPEYIFIDLSDDMEVTEDHPVEN